jgi:hypothetical protein
MVHVQIDKGVDVNILMFIPTVIIGMLGGGLGALFTIINLKVARLRRRFLARMEAKWKQNIFRMSEPAVIMVRITVKTAKRGHLTREDNAARSPRCLALSTCFL